MKPPGTVYLVGAGPGDAELLTLRGAALLRRADVVVHDALVNPELLGLVPRGAEIIRRTKDHPPSQAALTALLVERARAGQCVIRLKGGDPYTFGRGGEEAQGLAAAGIPFEVVPGVSSVMAVPNYAGIPLTHRAHGSSFTVITGHRDPLAQGSGLDWDLMVRLPGTKVILMGVERIAQLAETLVARGLAPNTPVAMVRMGTTGQQQTIAGTLADIGQRAAQAAFSAPAVTIIGGVVSLRSQLNWFERRPLFGQRIVVTRARDQAAQLTGALRERGADVLEVPCIRIGPPTEHRPLVEAMAGLGEYDWVIFTSANGVGSFFDYFFKAFEDLRDLGAVRLAAVGPGTAARLAELHLKVDLVPNKHTAREIAKELLQFQSLENVRVLLLRAEVANPELPRLLEENGAIVDDIACYRTVADTDDRNGAAARLVESGADWVTFTSGSTVEHFHARFDLPRLLRRYPALKVATLGPEATKALATLGLEPAVEADPHTVPGLVAAVERVVCRDRKPA
ncbi:MAG: uroporphyrinogen-III C-methyltransferase [Verrucomicrobia bacterium]|nr:uroporphyrinogen-III C-methyltransferase [Verrucomicrobiota bacterium]